MAGEDVKKGQKASRAWDSLKPSLSPWILEAMDSMGFKKMTPVQASTIPLAMGNKDVVVEAVTGSGKTLSFLIPVVEKLLRLDEPLKKHHVGGIIVSPTRELAAQIYRVLQELLMFHGPSKPHLQPEEESSEDDEAVESAPVVEKAPKIITQLLVGGDTTPMEDLKMFLKNSPNLLVATPGRLLELLKSPHVKCPQSSFEILILDEADRLLDLGFKEDLQNIIGRLPKQRRTGLFSASVSEAVDQIIRVGLRNPVKISVKVKSASGKEDSRTPASLSMTYILAKPSQKLPALNKVLTGLTPAPTKTIIYLSTCAAVDYMQHLLPTILNTPQGPTFSIVPLHGKHPANVRQKNFTKFSNSFMPSILLTTDVAARGLDIPQVDLVVQIDPPSDPKVFMHRCGRAGRAGRKGLSIIFLNPGKEEDYVQFLEIRKTPIKPFDVFPIDVSDQEADIMSDTMRDVVRQDRALYDKGQRAFVSWVHAYSKHQTSSIFRIIDQDWADLGRGWALLRLPKMPEAKKWGGDRSLGVDMDWNNYGYKDKQREIARLNEMQRSKDESGDTRAQKKEKQSWSVQHEIKEEREKRREKRHAKRSREKMEKMTPEERKKQEELDHLIAEVKRQKMTHDGLDEFEGFDD